MYNEFKAKWIGHGCDFDGYYGFQCMDLAEQYNRDVVGAKRIGGDAKEAWTKYDTTKYDRISNTPTGVPKQGDIVVWGAMPGNPYGHIGIFDNGDINKFQSLDQNWPVGSITHLQNHNYSYLLGWLHPKASLTDDQREQKIREILGKQIPAAQHIAQIREVLK